MTKVARVRRLVVPLSVASALMLTLAACGGGGGHAGAAGATSSGSNPTTTTTEPPARPVTGPIAVSASDRAFNGPRAVFAGLVRVTFTNAGNAQHELAVNRLAPGATFAQVEAAVRAHSLERVASLVAPAGGVPALPPGRSEVVILDLQPGDYVLASLERGTDGTPDVARGLLAPLKVSAPAAHAAPAPPPAVDGDVAMRDMTFVLPPHFGRGTYRVTNQGPSSHMMVVVRLDPPHTGADVKQSLTGPPPAWAHEIGGLDEVPTHAVAYVVLDLPPGHYALVCFSSDATTHAPHAAQGMISDFDVA